MLVRDTLPVALGGCCRIAYTILSKTDLGAAADEAEGCCVAVAAVAAVLATFAILAGGLDLEPTPGAADAAFFDLEGDGEDGMFSYFTVI